MVDRAETYLGDGLYASFDGYTIWLRVERTGGEHIVALEPLVYIALLEFVQTLPKKASP